ncbi:Ferric/cupric reductase transmembrane component 1 [Yarrowia sp. C11]|nr:Ferric/cupric reductase transmembrane component 1 [Yarrowia sp. E02]KAG5369665.1 Ferric/cupric reductase transmembrane component 1 [Yarrowia sp. C11]
MNLLLLLTLLGLVCARDSPKLGDDGRFVRHACIDVTAENFNFGVTSTEQTPKPYFQQQCSNKPYLQTVLKCMQDHTDEITGRKMFENYLGGECKEHTHKKMLSLEELEPVPELVSVSEEDRSKPQTEPVVIPEELYRPSYNSYVVLFRHRDVTTYLGIGILCYWVLIIAIGGVVNLSRTYLFPVMCKMTGLHINTLRKHISLPAAFGYKHSQPFRVLRGICSMCMPTRVQSVIVTFYLLFVFIACFPGYHIIEHNTLYPGHTAQLRKYLAMRTGILSFAQLPLLFLFAGRNNIMMWVTGWSFDTFNVYHRWIARVMIALAICHGIPNTILYADSLSFRYSMLFYFMGVIAIISGSFMCIQGLHFFRSRWYEMFLVIHITLALLFTIAIWLHADLVGFQEWVYAAVAVWAFDHLARYLRIIFSGVVCNGEFTIIDHNDRIVRVEIAYSKLWKVYPGAHVFIYVLTPWKFWESHPFTIYQSPTALENGNISIMLKAKSGMTLKIFNHLLEKNDHANIKLFVEGPYGHQLPVRNYDSTVVVAGGIGVTATYSYAADLLQCPSTKSIIFAWVVRNDAAIDWFRDELNSLLQDDRVQVNIFVSAVQSSIEKESQLRFGSYAVSESDEKKSASSTAVESHSDGSSSTRKLSKNLNIVYGNRPNMSAAIPGFLGYCEGPTAIVICGPPVFNDDIRLAVSESLDIKNERVDYFEEAFSW